MSDTLNQVHAHFCYPEYLWHNDERYPLPMNVQLVRIGKEAGGR
jgi:hypothetical protein